MEVADQVVAGVAAGPAGVAAGGPGDLMAAGITGAAEPAGPVAQGEDGGAAWAEERLPDDDGTGSQELILTAPSASAAAPRADILRARRRMLIALIALTGAALALAVTHFAGFWVVIPPALLLAGFVVLLREAARIDAERSGQRTPTHHAASDAGAGQEPGTVPGDVDTSPHAAAGTGPLPAAEPFGAEPFTAGSAGAESPGADVIDISGRIADQVYDQYADAEERAVGD